jgi:hypothetical protein
MKIKIPEHCYDCQFNWSLSYCCLFNEHRKTAMNKCIKEFGDGGEFELVKEEANDDKKGNDSNPGSPEGSI